MVLCYSFFDEMQYLVYQDWLLRLQFYPVHVLAKSIVNFDQRYVLFGDSNPQKKFPKNKWLIGLLCNVIKW